MKTDIKRLYSWNDWANREALASLSGAKNGGDALKTLAHIIAAEHLWIDRIQGRVSTTPVWPSLSTQQCLTEIDKLRELWDRLIMSITDTELERKVSYTNSKGESFSDSVKDILSHVVFHGSYHRGQIARDVRNEGGTPAYTDFIHAVRTGKIGA